MQEETNSRKPMKALVAIIFWGFTAILIISLIVDFSRANSEGKARDCISRGNYQQAVAIYNALPGGPKSLSALDGRADCYFVLGQYEKAILDYDRLTVLAPTRAWIFSDRGDCHFKLQHYEQAYADYDKAIRLEPKLARAYSGRGNCFFQKDNLQQAVADYSSAIALKPEDAALYFNRAKIYEKSGKNELAEKDKMTASKLGHITE